MTVARVAAALLLLLPACALGDIWNTGCGNERASGVEVADVVGTFGDDKTGTLTLGQDGTFEAKGLRRKDRDGAKERVMAGTGTWKLNEREGRTKRSETYADIPLTFDDTGETWYRVDIAATAVHLASGGIGFDLKLYYLLGDFGNCDIVTLERAGDGKGLRPAQPSPADRRSRRPRRRRAAGSPGPA